MAGEQKAYLDSSRNSEQLSCRNLFHPSYGLFYMIFQSFKRFSNIITIKIISEKEYDIIMTSSTHQQSTDQLTNQQVPCGAHWQWLGDAQSAVDWVNRPRGTQGPPVSDPAGGPEAAMLARPAVMLRRCRSRRRGSGLHRKRATGGHFKRSRARSEAGGAAHPAVASARAEAGCNNGNVEQRWRRWRVMADSTMQGTCRRAERAYE